MAVFMDVFNFSQSILLESYSICAKFMEPRLQLSKAIRGTSPQGLVLCILPNIGVVLALLIVFKKNNPGLPVSQAC